MKTLAVDSNNDIFIAPDGNLAINLDILAAEETCAQYVKAQLGEMILATTTGMPNFQTVWNGQPNVAQFQAFLRATILSVTNVTGITELTINVEGGILSYSATIQTIYGIGVVNGTV